MTNPLLQAAHRKPHETPKQPSDDEQLKSKKPPSTLEALANVLSLPGSSVLDTVTGHNPLDQWLDPIGRNADTNRTTGRQALRQFGLAGDKDTWGNAIAGFAVEAATDPLSYTGIGALTKGGKVLSKAGLLRQGSGVADSLAAKTSKTVQQVLDEADDAQAALRAFRHAGGTDDLLDQPLQSLVKFRLPGSKGVSWSGDAAQPVAKAIDAVADKVLDIPGMRSLRAAFSPAVMNAATKAGQDIAEHRKLAIDDALTDVGHQFAPIVKNNNLDGAKLIFDNVRREASTSGLDLSRFSDSLSPKDVSAALQHSEHLTKASGMAHAGIELLGTNATTNGTGVPLTEALKRLGMDTDAARKNLQDWLGDSLSLDDMSIDENLLADAGRFVRPYTDPEAIGAARKAVETFTRLFKSHVTMPFLSFHSRNLFSGQLQNVLFGASDPTVKGPLAYVKPLTQAYKLRSGRTLKGLSHDIAEFRELGLTDREATEALNNEIFAQRLIGDSQNAADIGKAVPDPATRMPGAPRERNPILQKGALNPLKPEVFIPTRLGGDVAGFVEELNRLAPFIAYRKQGYTADAAANLVKKIQVDYESATHWERKYGRNVVPFWMFASRMVPLVAKELVQHPGGPMAQAVRASGRASQDNPQPHWLRGQTTLPIGAGHIGGLGLMHDDAASLLGAAISGDVTEIAKDVGGRLNPLLKLPIELASGQSLYHSRPYQTLKPDLGATLHNVANGTGRAQPFVSHEAELALRNSPAARYLAALRKLTDHKQDAKQLATSLATGMYYVPRT
jgi:hypothetical protein